mmetsp:Transcript_31188/g.56567  ORF Transcript_31188/g.56567 Transcript_31188/m.56567 type:complete len:622 (-) Transcript_31188:69-1934(-)
MQASEAWSSSDKLERHSSATDESQSDDANPEYSTLTSRFKQYRRCGSPALATRQSRLASAALSEGSQTANVSQSEPPAGSSISFQSGAAVGEDQRAEAENVRHVNYDSYSRFQVPDEDAKLQSEGNLEAAPTVVKAHRFAAGRAMALLQAATGPGHVPPNAATAAAIALQAAAAAKEAAAGRHGRARKTGESPPPLQTIQPSQPAEVSSFTAPPSEQSQTEPMGAIPREKTPQRAAADETQGADKEAEAEDEETHQTSASGQRQVANELPAPEQTPRPVPPSAPSKTPRTAQAQSSSSTAEPMSKAPVWPSPRESSKGSSGPTSTKDQNGEKRSLLNKHLAGGSHDVMQHAEVLPKPVREGRGASTASMKNPQRVSRASTAVETVAALPMYDPFWQHVPNMGIRALSSSNSKAEEVPQTPQAPSRPPPQYTRPNQKKDQRPAASAKSDASQGKLRSKTAASASQQPKPQQLVVSATTPQQSSQRLSAAALAPSLDTEKEAPEAKQPVGEDAGQDSPRLWSSDVHRYLEVRTRKGRSETPPKRSKDGTWRVPGHIAPKALIARRQTKSGPKEKYLAMPFSINEEDPRHGHLWDTMEMTPGPEFLTEHRPMAGGPRAGFSFYS